MPFLAAKAASFFADVLNNDSKNAQAYIGKTLAQAKLPKSILFVEITLVIYLLKKYY